jgi:hypothetical protein
MLCTTQNSDRHASGSWHIVLYIYIYLSSSGTCTGKTMCSRSLVVDIVSHNPLRNRVRPHTMRFLIASDIEPRIPCAPMAILGWSCSYAHSLCMWRPTSLRVVVVAPRGSLCLPRTPRLIHHRSQGLVLGGSSNPNRNPHLSTP